MLTAEQLEIRKSGIGGSEIAAVLGLDPYRGPLDVWLSKVEGYQQPVTAPMERGTFLEDGLANWYAHRTGATLERWPTVFSGARPLALCTPDRVAALDGKRRLLSIKAPGPWTREEWGDEWTEDVPLAYLLQLQWEDLVLSDNGEVLDDEMHLAAGPIDGDLRIFKLRRDRELQASAYEQAHVWWQRHIVGKEAPAIDGSDTAAEWLKRRFPRNSKPLLKATPDDEVLALALMEADAAFDVAEEKFDAAANRLKERIGEANGIEGAFGVVTWLADKNGKRSLRPKWRRQ